MLEMLKNVSHQLSEEECLYDIRTLREMGRADAIKKYGAQLPRSFFLLMHRIVSIEKDDRGATHGVAEYDISPLNLLFKVHFAGRPILPAVFCLEGLHQFIGLVGHHLGCKGQGVVGRCSGYRPLKRLGPQTGTLRYEVTVQKVNTRRSPHFIRAKGRVLDREGDVVFISEGITIVFR